MTSSKVITKGVEREEGSGDWRGRKAKEPCTVVSLMSVAVSLIFVFFLTTFIYPDSKYFPREMVIGELHVC